LHIVTGFFVYLCEMTDVMKNLVNELRLGNLIKPIGNFPHWNVTSKDFEYIENHPCEYEEIQVTEEILLRFGFVKNEWESVDKINKGTDYFNEETCCRVSLDDDCCQKGVHWFQNWYYFNEGEELKYK